MKTKLGLIVSLMGILMLTACSIGTQKENVAIANPASVFCEDNGGTLELIFDFGETYGVCHFPDGSFCEEWDYYHGECGPKGESDEPNENIDEIYDFESCKSAGGIVQKIYPAICHFDGKDFIQNIDKENLSGQNISIKEKSNTLCTADVKKCPDGTYIGRVGPNCEFAPCPTSSNIDLYQETHNLNQTIKEHAQNIDSDSPEITEDSIDFMEKIIEFFTKKSKK